MRQFLPADRLCAGADRHQPRLGTLPVSGSAQTQGTPSSGSRRSWRRRRALSCMRWSAKKTKTIQATKAKSRFLASMSHELRTPVSAIVGFLELLAKPELNGGQRKEAIELAGSTAQTLLGLIGNILDIDKIESGKCEGYPAVERCRTVSVAAAVSYLRRTGAAKGHRSALP